MKYISPTQLFNEHLASLGEAKALVVLDNFILAEKVFRHALRYLNVGKLTMIVKVKNSAYSIKYTYDKSERMLVADKLLKL